MKHIGHTKLFVLQGMVYVAFLMQLMGVPIPQTLILIFAMIVPAFLSKGEIAAYIVGFSMLGTGIQVAYIALSCCIVVLVNDRGHLKLPQFIIPAGLFCYEIAHMLFYPSDSYIELIRYIFVYFLLIYIMYTEKKTSEKLLLVHSYINATVFAVIHVFIQSYLALNGNINSFLSGTLRFGYAEQIGTSLTFSADPNLIAQSCSITIAFCLGLILMGNMNWKYFASALICVLAGLLTISKTFLLSLGLIAILYIMFTGSFGGIKTLLKRIGLVAIIVVTVILIYNVYPSYLENISSRIVEGDITNGRTRLFLYYIEYLLDHPIAAMFGIGIQNLGEKINSASPHAAIIEVWASWGIVGVVVTIKVIIDSIKIHRGKNKPQIINYIPFFIFMVLVQSTQLFRLRDRIFGLIAVIAFIGFNRQRLIEEQEETDIEKSFIDY